MIVSHNLCTSSFLRIKQFMIQLMLVLKSCSVHLSIPKYVCLYKMLWLPLSQISWRILHLHVFRILSQNKGAYLLNCKISYWFEIWTWPALILNYRNIWNFKSWKFCGVTTFLPDFCFYLHETCSVKLISSPY